MHIAVFIKNTTLHNHFGGFETQNKVLCEGLADRGHKVTVFAPKKELTMDQAEENGVTYVFVDCIFAKKFNVLFSASGQSWNNRSYEEFMLRHNENNFDVVLSQSSWALGIIKNKTQIGIPIIAISHGSKMGEVQTLIKSINSPKRLIRFFIDIPHILRAFFITQRQFIRGATNIIAVSNAVKKQIIDETFIPGEKVTVIHNGINPENLLNSPGEETKYDSGKNGREVNIIFVGRVERPKGVYVLADVAKQLKQDNLNFKINIYGDGADFIDLKKYVATLSIDDVVKLHGKTPYNVVISKYLESDVFVLPTLRVEGFPMTIVEAMFAGLPCVVSNLGGNSDAISNNSTGFLLEPGNKQQLAETLTQLINDVELRKRLGQNGKLKAQEQFTQKAMVQKYEQVMQKLL